MILLMVFILLFNVALADSLRCGRKIVKQGDSDSVLIKKCGDPLRKFSSKEMVSDSGQKLNVTVSNWVYERFGKKDMIVSIRSGTVVKIQTE